MEPSPNKGGLEDEEKGLIPLAIASNYPRIHGIIRARHGERNERRKLGGRLSSSRHGHLQLRHVVALFALLCGETRPLPFSSSPSCVFHFLSGARLCLFLCFLCLVFVFFCLLGVGGLGVLSVLLFVFFVRVFVSLCDLLRYFTPSLLVCYFFLIIYTLFSITEEDSGR